MVVLPCRGAVLGVRGELQVTNSGAEERRPRAAAWTGSGSRDWVIRTKAEGLPCLSDRVAPDPAFRLSPAQMTELATLIDAGPDPAVGLQHDVKFLSQKPEVWAI